jgi:nucleotide-binding universal stress UspA family protein
MPATSQVTVLHVEPSDDRVLYLLTTTAPKFRVAVQVLILVTKERGRQALERVRKVVTHRGLTVHPLLVEGRPAEKIIRAAERTHADLVLLRSQGMMGLKDCVLRQSIAQDRMARPLLGVGRVAAAPLKERADGMG